jgi:hypothetical protein
MKAIGAVLYLLGLFATRFLVVLGAFVVAHAVVASFGELRLMTVFGAGERFADMRTGMAVVALVVAILWQLGDVFGDRGAPGND